MATTTSTTFDQYRGNPAEIYEEHFVPVIGRPCAVPVVDAAKLRSGQRVLDVACGTGIAARVAKDIVGSGGRVVGVDGNPGMLEVARSSTPESVVIEWHEASADDLPFPDATFDAVLCSLGLQFFADKRGAVRQMCRVVASGGRVAIGVPGPTPPLFSELHDVLAEHLDPDVAAFVPVVFSIDDPATVHELMVGAGLSDVDVDTRSMTLHLPPPPHFFWQYMLGTPLASAVGELDQDQRAHLEHVIVTRWHPFVNHGGGMDIDVGLILATAAA